MALWWQHCDGCGHDLPIQLDWHRVQGAGLFGGERCYAAYRAGGREYARWAALGVGFPRDMMPYEWRALEDAA